MIPKTLAVSLVVCVLLTSVIAPPVAADESGMFEFNESDDGLISETTLSFIGSLSDRVGAMFSSDEENVSTHAENAEEVLKKHDAEFISYANTHVPDSVNKTNYDSFKVCLSKDGETTHRYVESPVENGSYTNLTVDQSANQTVDKTLHFEGYQVTQLDTILNHTHENYVSEDKAPDGALKGYLGGQLGRDYADENIEDGDVSC